MYFAVNILSYFLSYFMWMHVLSTCTSVHVCAVLVEVACCGQFCRTSPGNRNPDSFLPVQGIVQSQLPSRSSYW